MDYMTNLLANTPAVMIWSIINICLVHCQEQWVGMSAGTLTSNLKQRKGFLIQIDVLTEIHKGLKEKNTCNVYTIGDN